MLQPTIRVRGVVGGRQIIKSFAPSLPFTFSAAVLALNAPAPTTLPGASYDPPTTATTNETALQPVLSGSLPVRAPNSVSLVKFSLAVSVLRGLGLGLVGLALLGICTKPLRKKRETWSHEKRIAFRVGCVIVDVVSLESAVASTGVPTALPDFESLAHFARYLERPILRDAARRNATPSRTAAACTSSARRAAAEAAPKPVASFEHAPRVKASATGPRPARRRRTIVGGGRPALRRRGRGRPGHELHRDEHRAHEPRRRLEVDADAAPADARVLLEPRRQQARGRDERARSPARPRTTSCSAATRPERRRMNGGAGDDCIIAGGSTSSTSNAIDGGAGTDICIGAPGTAMTFANCEYTGTPSTGSAVTFSSWTGVSGTALTDIPTYTAADARPPRSASMETPVDRGDNLGSRLQAYLTVPATGSYTFWMASDDNGRLFLSTNADPANRVAIASVAGYTASEAWDTFPSQQSSPIALVAGQRYYIEAWAKEAGGGDNLSVAWSGPTISRAVISGDYLSTSAVGCSGWCPNDGAKPYRAQLVSFASKCADVLNGVTTDGSAVGDYPCNNGIEPGLDARLERLAAGLQLAEVPRAEGRAVIAADTPVVISTCNASAAQTWTYTSATGLLKLGSLCLEVPGANTADGLQLAIDTCDGTPEQNWAFAAGPAYTPDAPSGRERQHDAPSPARAAPTAPSRSTSRPARSGRPVPGSTLVGTVTATAAGAFSFAPAGSIVTGNSITASVDDAARRHVRRSRRTSAAASASRAGRAAPARPSQHQPNAPTSGFMLAYMPLGFGYQVQTCMVTSFGCQKLNAAPDCGLFVAHASALGSGANVPSL